MPNLKKLIANVISLGRRGDGYRPSKADKELMENVQARLAMVGHRPAGTTLRSIPGAKVVFVPMAGSVLPMVFEAGTERPIGSILPNGTINYVQPRS